MRRLIEQKTPRRGIDELKIGKICLVILIVWIVKYVRMVFSRKILIAVLIGAIWSPPGQAVVYPKREGNTDVIVLDDPWVDFTLRIALVDQAKHSVDVLSYMQSPDPTGMPFIRALRDAADRGLRVRYLYEALPSVSAGDLGAKSAKLISDVRLRRPAEVFVGRGYDKLSNGLFLDDFFHHKLLIVDAGTADERIVIGGRGYANFSVETSDSAFLLRPVDPSKPHVGQDVQQHVDSLFALINTISKPEKPSRVSSSLVHLADAAPDQLIRTEKQRFKLREIQKVVSVPPPLGGKDSLLPFEFQPTSMQIVTNDLIRSVNTSRPKFSIEGRTGLKNDINDVLIPLIEKSPSLDLTSYVIGLTDRMSFAVQELLNRGGKVRFITNGTVAHKKLAPGGIPIDYTFSTVIPMLQSDHPPDLYLLDANEAKFFNTDEVPAFDYVHRKLMLLGNEIVVSGSDNFTRSSAAKNDELVFIANDQKMSSYMRSVTDLELMHYNRIELKDALKGYLNRSWYSDCLQGFLRKLY